jgi:hypothetical protein
MTERSFDGPERRAGNGRSDGGPVCPFDDDECRELAQEIERERPGWLVVWGVYSKCFVAFPLFPVQRRTILVVSYPDALLSRMEEVERRWRVEPEPRG